MNGELGRDVASGGEARKADGNEIRNPNVLPANTLGEQRPRLAKHGERVGEGI